MKTKIETPPDADSPMSMRRIVIGVVGQCRNHVYGGAIVSVPRHGEYYATRQKTVANLMEAVASFKPDVWKKYGLVKFDNYADALGYARG